MRFYSRIHEWFTQVLSPAKLTMSNVEDEDQDTHGDELIAARIIKTDHQSETRPESEAGSKFSTWGGFWLEWLVILLAVTLFCVGILDLRAPTRLPGNESEVFQMLDWTLINSLKQYHTFPLWNMYIQSGLPYIADPMLHVYNPVVTLPVLLFGVRSGFKLGVYFSFLIAAVGMWRMAQVLGFGRATRLWVALMFAFAGQPVARFIQGQYLFVFGFAYIPWIISSLILVFRRKRRLDIAVAAGAIALLFFSGNAYYALYILISIGLFGLVMLLRIAKKRPYLSLDIRHTLIFLGIGALALGVIAIQLLPTAEFWPRLSKDMNLAGSQTVKQIFLDYTSKDSMRPDAYNVLPAREEFYAYIGFTPFIGLVLLPLAIWKRDRRLLLFFALILLLTVLWIRLEWMPWKDLLLHIRLFLQFRHLLRILIFGSFALICLAGIGFDTLWKSLELQAQKRDKHRFNLKRGIATSCLVILGIFLTYGIADLFTTNQFALKTQEIYTPAYAVTSWVRQNDPGDFYVRHNATNAWQDAMISNNLRFLDSWYHFADIRSLDGKINQRTVQAQPNYLTQSPSEVNPDNGKLISIVENYNIFYLPESLPMAFIVDNDKLEMKNEVMPLRRSEVTQLTPFFTSPNNIETITQGFPNQTLVLLITKYPGWQVLVDGKPQELKNVSGYMAVDIQPGIHKYNFLYRPQLFIIGSIVSLIASMLLLGIFFSDLQFNIRAIREKWLTFWRKLNQMRLQRKATRKRAQPQTSPAIYRDGTLLPSQPMELEENSDVIVTVEPQQVSSLGRTAWRHWVWATRGLLAASSRTVRLDMALFIVALGIYLSTRLIGLSDFPIYFFTDEAVQTDMAMQFVENDLRNYNGEILPTYFNKDATYNLSSVSVYLQVIPYLIFGKSEFVTRAVSVFVGTLGAFAIGLILRDIFKIRSWWCGVLLLSIAPAWFLHSRTAFETVEMTAFYAGFLYFYLRYRYISPRSLYPALVMGALVFYTYSPGQLIIVVTGIVLFFTDMRYHWQNRYTALRGLLLLVVLVLPYIRYSLTHPDALMQHLSTRAPFWIQNIPFTEKLRDYFSNYFYGLNPKYWFIPNQHDLDRHLMKGYGHLLLATLPLFIIGLVIVLTRLRSSAHRAVLFAMLISPAGSALVGIGITRALVFVIPAVLLMALGLDQLITWFERVLKWFYKRRERNAPASIIPVYLSFILLLVFGVANFVMLRDALVNGPTWFQDYTLAGMQYGARQLFTAVNDYVQEHPGVEMLVSPSWTNGADAVAEFFLPKDAPVKLGSVEGHLFRHLPIQDNTIFVILPAEMDKITSSGKLKNVRVEKVLPYPNGSPGFYFVRLQYVDNIDEILADEQEKRSALQSTTLIIQGESVQINYPPLDMGSIELLFDGNSNTVARTLEANPFIIELTFPQTRVLSGYTMILGSADMRVTAILYPANGGEPVKSVVDFDGSPRNPELDVDFGQSVTVQKARFEAFQPYTGVPSNVHIWEIELK